MGCNRNERQNIQVIGNILYMIVLEVTYFGTKSFRKSVFSFLV